MTELHWPPKSVALDVMSECIQAAVKSFSSSGGDVQKNQSNNNMHYLLRGCLSLTDRQSVNQQQHLRWNVKNVIRSCCCVWPSSSSALSSLLLSAALRLPLRTDWLIYKLREPRRSPMKENEREVSATSAGQLLQSPKNSVSYVATCSHTLATPFLENSVCSSICNHSEGNCNNRSWPSEVKCLWSVQLA